MPKIPPDHFFSDQLTSHKEKQLRLAELIRRGGRMHGKDIRKIERIESDTRWGWGFYCEKTNGGPGH